MKKFLALFFVLVIGIFSYGENEGEKTITKKFDFGADIYVYGASYKTTEKDGYLTFSAYSFWPYISFSTQNVNGKLQLGIDQFMGSGVTPSEDYAPIGSDVKNAVKIEQAYIEIKVPFINGLSFKRGVAEYEIPGALVLSDNTPLFMATYTFGDNNVSLVYIKMEEETPGTNRDDANMFGTDLRFKINNILFSPSIFFIKGGSEITNTPWANNLASLFSLLFSVELEKANINIAFAYGNSKDKGNNIKYSGYAVDIEANYNFSDNFNIKAFFAVTSGDNSATPDKYEGFNAFKISGVKGRLLLLENQQTFSTIANDDFANIRYLNYGYIIGGGSLGYNIDFAEVGLNFGYAQLMKEVSNTNNKKDLGFEIDLIFSINIEENTKILFEGAYLNTGGAFGTKGFGTKDIQNSIYAGLGVVVNF
ncbi:MAG TPA: hypothetical protein PKW55_02470 [Spirochaetota bacterium]|nr:hypothetical protein [Spirochaetota bacterium]HOM38287.1 hypothetical protein [Spirochaetota bacterium]HPQ48495.1 hypothetical protein [Spirochaetota bacterium]